jgi:hypothetical protein
MTIFSKSKDDVLNQDYANVNSLQLTPHTTAEITALAANDTNGTLYHNSTTNKLVVKLNGSVETITSS